MTHIYYKTMYILSFIVPIDDLRRGHETRPVFARS